MWQDVIKRKLNAERDAERYGEDDFLNEVAHQFRYVKRKIKAVYYPHFDEDRKEKFDILASKTYRFLKKKDLRKALRGVNGIKKMVNQFDLPALDYVREMLENRLGLPNLGREE